MTEEHVSYGGEVPETHGNVIRDERRHSFFIIDNELIDLYGPRIGAHGIAVYCALARYANERGEGAYPSYQTLAQKLGLSRPTVIKTVSLLIEHELVTKTERFSNDGNRNSNTYSLVPMGGGGKRALPGVVNVLYQGGKRALPDQDLIKKTQLEEDSSLTPDNEPTNGYANATPSLPDGKGTFQTQPTQTSFVQASFVEEEPTPDNTATLPRDYAKKPPTEQQEFFGAICECVGWDHRILTKEQDKQVAQTIGIIRKAGYTVDDLRRFRGYWFAKDWRGKGGQFPTLSQLRADIPKAKTSTSVSSSPFFKIKDLS